MSPAGAGPLAGGVGPRIIPPTPPGHPAIQSEFDSPAGEDGPVGPPGAGAWRQRAGEWRGAVCSSGWHRAAATVRTPPAPARGWPAPTLLRSDDRAAV